MPLENSLSPPSAADIRAIEAALSGKPSSKMAVSLGPINDSADLSFLEPELIPGGSRVREIRESARKRVGGALKSTAKKIAESAKTSLVDKATGGITSGISEGAAALSGAIGDDLLSIVDAIIPGDVSRLGADARDLGDLIAERYRGVSPRDQLRIRRQLAAVELASRVVTNPGATDEQRQRAIDAAKSLADLTSRGTAQSSDQLEALAVGNLLDLVSEVEGLPTRSRPCPKDAGRARDGSRCGGRSAESRGETSGYDTPENFFDRFN